MYGIASPVLSPSSSGGCVDDDTIRRRVLFHFHYSPQTSHTLSLVLSLAIVVKDTQHRISSGKFVAIPSTLRLVRGALFRVTEKSKSKSVPFSINPKKRPGSHVIKTHFLTLMGV